MNTYNDNLKNTVINTLAGINLQQQELLSEQTVAQYTLYHAQGTELTARDKADMTSVLVDEWEAINNQAVGADNQMYNLLANATDTGKVVATSITNTATAASNVQIAANAISLLASDIGAALNVATASLFNTDVYSRIENANSFVNNVANDARAIARNAMNASASTSEVIATEVLTLAKGSKAKVGAALKSTQAAYNKFSNLMIAEMASVTDASRVERQAEGSVDDADCAVRAANQSYTSANRQLNMGLTITVLSGFEITAAFTGLASVLPAFTAPPASLITIPDAAPSYYLTLIPAQNASIFSTDQAMQLFQQALTPGQPDSGFLAIDPPAAVAILLTVDAFGNAVTPGNSYVAYIFTELALPYKQYINNFSDLLSAPSAVFAPATALPEVLSADIKPGNTPDTMTVHFQAVPLALSAQEATNAANADAVLAGQASALANQATVAAQAAAGTIASSASISAATVQAAQSASAAANSDATTQITASAAADAAAQTAAIAALLTVATNAAAVAAAVASGTAQAAQRLLSVTPPTPASPAGATAGTDNSAKGKGKTPGNGDAADTSQAKASTAAPVDGAACLSAVTAADDAATWSLTAANGAALLVGLCTQGKGSNRYDRVLALAKAMAVANGTQAAASATASAAAVSARNAAAVASASASAGGSSAGAANSAATAAAAAAQASDAATTAAASANAAVTAASEGLTELEVVQAQQILVTTAGIVATAPAAGDVSPAISADLASKIIGAAAEAATAAALAGTAVTVTEGVFGAQATAATGPSAQDIATVQFAVNAVATAAQSCVTNTSANAASAATASASASQSAATTAAAGAAAATQAAQSSALAASAVDAMATASATAAETIVKSDTLNKLADVANERMRLTSAAAQSSAALAAQIAVAPPVSQGTILAAEAIANGHYEWRCMLLQVGGEPDLELKIYGDPAPMPQIYFNLSIAEQVSAANYVLAQDMSVDGPASPGTPAPRFRNPVWTVNITMETTDNFGNLLLPNTSYYLYILAVALNQGAQGPLSNTMSKCLGPYTLFPPAAAPAN